MIGFEKTNNVKHESLKSHKNHDTISEKSEISRRNIVS